MGHPDFTGNWVLATDNWFMTWIKICGMTNLEDALVAVEAGVDAVGFVFYEKSPRCVSVETAREIVGKLPQEIEKVGVFVGAPPEAVIEASNTVGLTAAQLYPDANNQLPMLSEEFFRKVQCDVIVALPARLLEGLKDNKPSGFLLSCKVLNRILAMLVDSGDALHPGGTGKHFNWEQVKWITEGLNRVGVRLIVAGGLASGNVGNAIGIFQPWGVDVASGVEMSPGKKDAEKVRAFVRAVREADREISA
jgi:phosphoribosylanthranilate isomerase